jgi:hypothetical protein
MTKSKQWSTKKLHKKLKIKKHESV